MIFLNIKKIDISTYKKELNEKGQRRHMISDNKLHFEFNEEI